MTDGLERLADMAGLSAGSAADAARSDQDARWKAGTGIAAERYLEALPSVAADPDLAMVLIYGEVHSRTARGETPDVADYCRRFPQWADRLVLQFQLHSALQRHPTDSPPLTDSTLPQTAAGGDAPPARIGPYTVFGEIGRGGMGVVYAAHDPSLDREVAVKTLRAGRSARAEIRARFAREARVTARLPHPGVPPVYAVGDANDTPYLAMKRVRGRTLAELLRDRPTPAAGRPELIRVVEAVAQAVGFAHAQGVIHRDLKPANVMVGAFGEVQVMDWGLASVLADRERERPEDVSPDPPAADLTGAGEVLGTPAHMAPEQARGEPTDRRADVFALGTVLCEVLTGRPPFHGADVFELVRQTATADLTGALARLRACGADAALIAPLPRPRPGGPPGRRCGGGRRPGPIPPRRRRARGGRRTGRVRGGGEGHRAAEAPPRRGRAGEPGRRVPPGRRWGRVVAAGPGRGPPDRARTRRARPRGEHSPSPRRRRSGRRPGGGTATEVSLAAGRDRPGRRRRPGRTG